jgi:hypothetical protein
MEDERSHALPSHGASLHVNGEPVGEVVARRRGPSWSMGYFAPNDRFSKFAAVFARWSLLMHAHAPDEPLSDATGEQLRRVEFEIDHLHAALQFLGSGEWVTCSQLNIDGPLIEWKRA